MSPDARRRLLKIREMCSYIELSADETFNSCFVEELGFSDDSGPEDLL